MLKLTKKAKKDANGWAKVSKAVWPSVRTLPSQLVELQETNDGGVAPRAGAWIETNKR